MDNLELIELIDQRLADSVDATRRGHTQIQQVMEHFRKKAQAEELKSRQQQKFKARKEATDANK